MNDYCPTCGYLPGGVTHICWGRQAQQWSWPIQLVPLAPTGWKCPTCGCGCAPWTPTCANCTSAKASGAAK